MKLSKLYTNQPKHFKPIWFNDGLNVVLGKITKPENQDRDSHNLGKSLLIDVIDYCLLKTVNQSHFTKLLPESLEDMEFYLEISLDQESFLTIKRNIKQNTKIRFKEFSKGDQDFTNIGDNEWDPSLSVSG